jgi:hypothetical protein
MKTYIPYSLLLAAAACGLAFGTTATTTPVGYYNYDAKLGDNYFVSGLVNTPSFAGSITGSSATTLNVAASALVANAYDAVGGIATHYVEIVTAGSNQGVVIDITSNTSSEITLASDITALALAGTEQIFVRSHVTVLSLFAGTESVLTPFSDSISFYNADGSLITFFYIGAGAWSSDFIASDGNSRPIDPGTGLIFNTAADVALTITGEVKSSPTVVQIVGDGKINIIGPVNPLVGSTKQVVELGFADMAPFSDSITVYAPGDNTVPLATYFADGAGNVTTDFINPSLDTFGFTKGAIFSSASDTSFRILSGL